MILSGQYRTFDQTWENIKKLIDLNQLDVYCHLWSTNEREISNVWERLKPKRFTHDNFYDFEPGFVAIEERVRLANPKNVEKQKSYTTSTGATVMLEDKIAGNASMNYSRKVAFDLIEEPYDNLVYCRYDLGFNNLFSFEKMDCLLSPLEESYNIISDIFAIMPFEYAKYYFLYNDYEKLHSTQWEPEFENYMRDIRMYGEENIHIQKKYRYCPHIMLLRQLYMNKVKQVTTNQLSVYIQR